MKCTLKAQCSKEDYLDNTEYSLECKYKNGFTYGFYEYKKYAEYDIDNLLYGNITEVALFDGWDVDGFTTIQL